MFKLTQKQKIELQKMAEKYGLRLLVLFGSRTIGKTHKTSDTDIAYLSRQPITLRDEAKMTLDLAPLLKNSSVDLVNIRLAPPLLLYAITQTGQVIYSGGPFEFYNLRAYAFKRYIEAKPLFELKEKRLNTLLNT